VLLPALLAASAPPLPKDTGRAGFFADMTVPWGRFAPPYKLNTYSIDAVDVFFSSGMF
jgi:hypothetical protein